MNRTEWRIVAIHAAIAGGILCWAAAASAHRLMDGPQYDKWCCSPVTEVEGVGDCAPIPASAVQITPEGYLVTLTAADHPRVKDGTTLVELFRYPDRDPSNDKDVKMPRTPNATPEARESNDDEYHACVLPSSQQFRCLMVPRANG